MPSSDFGNWSDPFDPWSDYHFNPRRSKPDYYRNSYRDNVKSTKYMFSDLFEFSFRGLTEELFQDYVKNKSNNYFYSTVVKHNYISDTDLDRLRHRLKHYNDYDKFNLIPGLMFYPIDIPMVVKAKVDTLKSILSMDTDQLQNFVNNVTFKYSRFINIEFDRLKLMYDIISKDPTAYNELSDFEKVAIAKSVGVEADNTIVKVGMKYFGNNHIFENMFKRYMYKSEFDTAKELADEMVKEKDLYDLLDRKSTIVKYVS